MTEYKGRLSTADQKRIVNYLVSGGSVRGAARDLGISYKQVRTFSSFVDQPEPVGKPLKVLFYDIETSMMVAYLWNTGEQYVRHDQIKEEQYMIAWSAKWADSKEIISDRLSVEEALARDEVRLTNSLASMLRQADVIVAHNGDGFDFKEVNTRVFLHQQDPIGPLASIDTYKLARANFRLNSNSLDYLARRLGLKPKIKTDLDLWKACMAGDEQALKDMLIYNRHDVLLLEQVFDKMKPYVRRMTRLFDGPGLICPFCGSPNLSNVNVEGKELVHRTQMTLYVQYQCADCGKFCRSKPIKEQRLPVAPL